MFEIVVTTISITGLKLFLLKLCLLEDIFAVICNPTSFNPALVLKELDLNQSTGPGLATDG